MLAFLEIYRIYCQSLHEHFAAKQHDLFYEGVWEFCFVKNSIFFTAATRLWFGSDRACKDDSIRLFAGNRRYRHCQFLHPVLHVTKRRTSRFEIDVEEIVKQWYTNLKRLRWFWLFSTCILQYISVAILSRWYECKAKKVITILIAN